MHCQADLTGVPDVRIPLAAGARVSSVTVHHSVQPPSTDVPEHLVFSPPLGKFQLCS